MSQYQEKYLPLIAAYEQAKIAYRNIPQDEIGTPEAEVAHHFGNRLGLLPSWCGMEFDDEIKTAINTEPVVRAVKSLKTQKPELASQADNLLAKINDLEQALQNFRELH